MRKVLWPTWCRGSVVSRWSVQRDPDAGLQVHREDFGVSLIVRSALVEPRKRDGQQREVDGGAGGTGKVRG